MPYPPPQPQSLHDWAAICNVDEIVAQALHVINDPLEHPPDYVLRTPTPDELDDIKACCKQWMDEGYYSRADTVNFDGATLRIDSNERV